MSDLGSLQFLQEYGNGQGSTTKVALDTYFDDLRNLLTATGEGKLTVLDYILGTVYDFFEEGVAVEHKEEHEEVMDY